MLIEEINNLQRQNNYLGTLFDNYKNDDDSSKSESETDDSDAEYKSLSNDNEFESLYDYKSLNDENDSNESRILKTNSLMTDESRNGENENLKNEIVIFKNNLEVLTSKNASLEETLSSILKNQNNPEYQELLEENTILKTLNISLKETYEKEIESLIS
jgi:hypothetical protein